MNYFFRIIGIFGLLLLGSTFFVSHFLSLETAQAGSNDNVSKWAWSETAGWISFNSTNCDSDGNGLSNGAPLGCPPSGTSVHDYGVRVAGNGDMSGFAWSEQVGWISFGQNNGCPSGSCRAHLDGSTGKMSGWAWACAGSANGDCTGGNRTDGWDGWIHLADNSGGSLYGVVANGCTWTGYAWGSDVMGWIRFQGTAQDGSPYNVLGSGQACANNVSVDLLATAQQGPITIPYNGSALLTWSSQNANGCTASGGTWSGSRATQNAAGESTGALSSSQTYTLTCNGPGGQGVDTVVVNVTPPQCSDGIDNDGDGLKDFPADTSCGQATDNDESRSGITSFTATPSNINPGLSSLLSWATVGFTSCSLNQGIGSVAVNGTRSVTPAQTTAYTLTCNPGNVSQQTTVTVGKVPKFQEIKPQ